MRLISQLRKFVAENGATLNQIKKQFPNENVDAAVDFLVKSGVLATEEKSQGAVTTTVYSAPDSQSTVYRVEKGEDGQWALVSQTLPTSAANTLVVKEGWSRKPAAATKKAVAYAYQNYKDDKAAILSLSE